MIPSLGSTPTAVPVSQTPAAPRAEPATSPVVKIATTATGMTADLARSAATRAMSLFSGTPADALQGKEQMGNYLKWRGQDDALHTAALGTTQSVEKFEAAGGDKKALLQFAFKHRDVLEHYLDSGGNINALELYRSPLLHYALRENHMDVVEMLLQKPQDVVDMQVHDHFGDTFAVNANLDQFFRLLDIKGVDIVKALDKKGRNLLHRSIYSNPIKAQAILDTKGLESDTLNARDERGCTPMHLALEQDYIKTLDRLAKDPRIDFSCMIESAAKDGRMIGPLEWRIEQHAKEAKSRGYASIPQEIMLNSRFNLKDPASNGERLLDFIKDNDPSGRILNEETRELIDAMLVPRDKPAVDARVAAPRMHEVPLKALQHTKMLKLLLNHPEVDLNTKLKMGHLEGTLFDIALALLESPGPHSTTPAMVRGPDQGQIVDLAIVLLANGRIDGDKQAMRDKLCRYSQDVKYHHAAVEKAEQADDLRTVRDLLARKDFAFNAGTFPGDGIAWTILTKMLEQWLGRSDWRALAADQTGSDATLPVAIVRSLVERGVSWSGRHEKEGNQALKTLFEQPTMSPEQSDAAREILLKGHVTYYPPNFDWSSRFQ